MRTLSPEESIELELQWIDYARRLREDAFGRLSDPQIESCVAYARLLFVARVPVIFDDEQLCRALQTDLRDLNAMTYRPERFYRKFTINKRSGGKRMLCEPAPALKAIQRWILDNILSAQWLHPAAHGFVEARSIKSNALKHFGARSLVRFDIADFFGSVGTGAVFRIFETIGYHRSLCHRLAHLCTFQDQLPQGAPSSPALANLFLREFDASMARLAKEYRLRYTRYADDLTFSGAIKSPHALAVAVSGELARYQLTLRHKKTHLMRPSQRMRVTGLIINDKVQAPRTLRRYLRQKVYYLRRFTLEGHVAHVDERRAYYLDHLMGVAGFICWVNPMDREARESLEYLRAEKARLAKIGASVSGTTGLDS